MLREFHGYASRKWYRGIPECSLSPTWEFQAYKLCMLELSKVKWRALLSLLWRRHYIINTDNTLLQHVMGVIMVNVMSISISGQVSALFVTSSVALFEHSAWVNSQIDYIAISGRFRSYFLVFLATASENEQTALVLLYCHKVWELEHSARRYKRNCINSDDFSTV